MSGGHVAGAPATGGDRWGRQQLALRTLTDMPAKTKPAPAIPVTSTPEANDFLVQDPLELLIGMLLDQHIG